MARVALFHSVLGVRPGITDAAERLRAAGHEVLVVDQYDGRVFDDYESAGAFVESVGFPELMGAGAGRDRGPRRRLRRHGLLQRRRHGRVRRDAAPVSGVLMLSGALPLEMLGVDAWPAGVPAQIHYAEKDPFRQQEWIDAVVEKVRETAEVETFDYAGGGTSSPTRRDRRSTTRSPPPCCGSASSRSALRVR